MPTDMPRELLERFYENSAMNYLRSLPLEHFAEARSQAKQREMTLASLDLVHARRPDVHVFNELLVQYPRQHRELPGQVVPDNLVVIHSEPIKANWSFDLPLQPSRPFWVLDYISGCNKRKDYKDNRDKYEHELKVPYYLTFVTEAQEMALYHHDGEKYARVKSNSHGRCEILELELEVGLQDGWMRYWFRRELLLMPAELYRELQQARQVRLAAEQEVARLRAEVERLKQIRQ